MANPARNEAAKRRRRGQEEWAVLWHYLAPNATAEPVRRNRGDPAPNAPSSISRVCSPYTPVPGGLQRLPG